VTVKKLTIFIPGPNCSNSRKEGCLNETKVVIIYLRWHLQ